MAMRRELAARAIAEATNGDDPIRLRIAMPEGLGYRLIFAHLRAHWRAIGVEAERVALGRPADLVFLDEVAPVQAASWYLRRFACPLSPVCSETADRYLEATLAVFGAEDRRLLIAGADTALEDAVAFISIAAPVRWSLVSPRVSGFRPNIFARHPAGELIADRP
jgi:peptide/nickel transport system substrate-binding protein